MAKKSRISTSEQIVMKQEEVKSQLELLDKLNLELKELEAIKLQEDKDDLYDLVNNTGMTKGELEQLLSRVAASKQAKFTQNENMSDVKVLDKVESVGGNGSRVVEDKQVS